MANVVEACPQPVHHGEDRPTLLVLASTYPRWRNDPEPGFIHELSRRLTPWFRVKVLCPHAAGATALETMDGVEILRYRYAPPWLERLVNDGGITTNVRRHRWMLLLIPGFLLSQMFQLWRLLRRDAPAVIHAHWIVPQALSVALVVRLLRQKPPCLVTSHGADLFALNGRAWERIKRWTLRRVQGWSVVSTAMHDPMAALGVPRNAIRVAPMGVDLAGRFLPDPAVARLTHDLLFVGRLVEKKGLKHLLDALPHVLRRHPGTRLTIVGFGPERDACERQVAALGLASCVRFAGATAQDQLPHYYRRSALLVAPFVQAVSGDQEGLGLVMVEALGCGCPVVTTRLPAVLELQGGRWPPYVAPPADPVALAEQINLALDDPATARDWAASMRTSLVERFDHAAVAARYAGQLQSLMRVHG